MGGFQESWGEKGGQCLVNVFMDSIPVFMWFPNKELIQLVELKTSSNSETLFREA